MGQTSPATTVAIWIEFSQIECELGWNPASAFEAGIRKTVQWYLDHNDRVKMFSPALTNVG